MKFEKKNSLEWVMPSVLLLFIIKLILVEKYFFLDYMVGDYSFAAYFEYQIPFFIIYKVALIMVIFAPAYFLKSKNRIRYAMTMNILLTLYFVIMSVYFRGFRKFPSFYSLLAIRDLLDVLPSVMALFTWKDIIIFMDVPIFMMILRNKQALLPKKNIKIGMLYLIVGLMIVLFIPYQLEKTVKKLGDDVWRFYHEDPVFMVKNSSPLYRIGQQIVKFSSNRGRTRVSLAEVTTISDFFNRHDVGMAVESDYKSIAMNKNLILIHVESLESQVLLRSVNGKEITPNLNALIEKSVYFPNVIEQVRDGNSSDTELMINTGLYPLEDGAAFYKYAERTYAYSLPNILKKYDYTSYAAHGDRETFWNRNVMYPNLSYDYYWGIESYESDELIQVSMILEPGLSDGTFFRQNLKRMKALPTPYLMNLITLTSHSPFSLPEEFIVETFDEIEDASVRRYCESIAYTDATIGEFINGLEAEGLLEDAFIVVFGDHEGLNKYYRGLPLEWQNNKKLPFILYAEGVKPDIIELQKNQVDMMPTILYMMGISPSEHYMMGRNMFMENNADTAEEFDGNNMTSYEYYRLSEEIMRHLE